MSRRAIALGIIGVWAIALALYWRRTTHRTPEQMLAEVAARVAPETYYYIVEQGGKQVGAASSAIDTTRSRLVMTDFVRGVIRVGPDSLRLQARSQARFSRGLLLRDFIVQAEGDLTPFEARGIIEDNPDPMLRLTAEPRGGRPLVTEFPLTGPLFFPTSAPLPLMLRERPKIGREMQFQLFDPIGRTTREVTLRIEADTVFTVTDSATLDTMAGIWVEAHKDTVRAWRIGGDAPVLTAWVDASGRLVQASEPGGISLRRTAFEIAFENLRRAGRQVDSASARRPGPGGRAPPR
jgi:hypothetical protein